MLQQVLTACVCKTVRQRCDEVKVEFQETLVLIFCLNSLLENWNPTLLAAWYMGTLTFDCWDPWKINCRFAKTYDPSGIISGVPWSENPLKLCNFNNSKDHIYGKTAIFFRVPITQKASEVEFQLPTIIHRYPSTRALKFFVFFEHFPTGWWAGSAATFCLS